MSGVVLAVDIGGTKTLAGIVDRSGRVLAEAEQPTRQPGVDELDRAFRFACWFAAARDAARPLAVVAGVPEYVAADGTVSSCEVLNWERQPATTLAERAAECFAGQGGPPSVEVNSDVRLGALGESAYGAGRGLGSFLYVSLGTGLSSTLVIDGAPWAGARGQAIALGERVLEPGRNLEACASGTGLARRYADRTGDAVPGPEIVRRASAGDAEAAGILRTAGEALGDALADAVELLDPHAVIVGGGLGAAETPLMDAARARYGARAGRRPGAAELLIAACGKRSALLGAAAEAWRLVSRRGA